MAYKADVKKNEEIDEIVLRASQDVDLTTNPSKRIVSTKIVLNGKEYWKASHKDTGIIWVANENDPKIINKVTGKGRGWLGFSKNGEATKKGGRPKGSATRMTVKQACDKLSCNPMEFLAAVVTGDPVALRGFNIRNPKEVTLAQKIKCAEVLVNKLAGNAKSVDVDEQGNAIIQNGSEERASQIQVYLPSNGKGIKMNIDDAAVREIEDVGVDQYITNHASELDVHDGNEDDKFVWTVQED